MAVSVGAWRDGRVLLVHRKRPPLAGLWTFPGGHVELGEAVEDAARREVLEETGLHVTITGAPLVHEIVTRDTAGAILSHHVLLVYAAHAATGDPVAASDAAAADFFTPEAAAGLASTPRLDYFIAETGARLMAGRRS
nr:NUDIX domain-containing protein [Chthonobacter rhizosphaerae]